MLSFEQVLRSESRKTEELLNKLVLATHGGAESPVLGNGNGSRKLIANDRKLYHNKAMSSGKNLSFSLGKKTEKKRGNMLTVDQVLKETAQILDLEEDNYANDGDTEMTQCSSRQVVKKDEKLRKLREIENDPTFNDRFDADSICYGSAQNYSISLDRDKRKKFVGRTVIIDSDED